MKSVSYVIVVLATLMLVQLDCKMSPGPAAEGMQDFQLNIVAFGPLAGSDNSSIPDAMKEACSPLDRCDPQIFIPAPTLRRIDRHGSAVRLETKSDPGMAGNGSNMRFRKREIEQHLSDFKLDESMMAPVDKSVDVGGLFDSCVVALGPHDFAICYSSNSDAGDSVRGLRICSSTDTLSAVINEALCAGKYKTVTLFWDPPTRGERGGTVALLGTWKGAIDIDSSQHRTLELNFMTQTGNNITGRVSRQVKDETSVDAFKTSVNSFTGNIAADNSVIIKENVRYPMVDGTFEGRLTPDRKTISGKWNNAQGTIVYPFSVAKQ